MRQTGLTPDDRAAERWPVGLNSYTGLNDVLAPRSPLPLTRVTTHRLPCASMFRDWISGFSVTFAPPEQFSAAANGGQLGAGPTPDGEELAVPVGRGNVVMVPVGPTWPTPTRFRLSMENHMFPELSDVSSDGFAKGPRGPIRLVVWPTVSVAGSARSTQLPGCRPAPTATQSLRRKPATRFSAQPGTR